MYRLVSNTYYRRTPSWKILQGLMSSQRLPREELQALQLKKLKGMAEYLMERSVFWRRRLAQAKLNLLTLSSLEDLQRLPILEKGDLENIMLQDRVNTSRLVVKRTGGSTGEPVTLYASASHVHWSVASMLRFYTWVGYQVGEKRAKLFAAPTRTGIPESNIRVRLRNRLGNTLYLDALNLTPERTVSVISSLQGFSPRLLFGYTSCLAIVSRALQAQGRTLGIPDLKIVNSAEPIDAHNRRHIEAGLGGTLFDHYGTRDVGYIADECELRQGLHVHMEYLVVEIVDENGCWVKDGEEGDILITELENYGMPTLRYRIGDRAVRADAPCACGRGLQVIPQVIGRSTDVIVLPNGNRLTGLVFPHLLKDFPVVEYQITQKRLDYLEAKLVLEPDVESDVLPTVHKALQQVMPGIKLKIVPVDSISRSRSGKLRSVVSDISSG